MQDGFDFPEHGAMWMPLQPTEKMLARKVEGFFAIGRLSAGVTLKRARAELDGINQTLEIAFPASNKGVRATARSFSEFELGPDAKMIYGSVWAAAGFVLLIACAKFWELDAGAHVGPGAGIVDADRAWRGALEDGSAALHGERASVDGCRRPGIVAGADCSSRLDWRLWSAEISSSCQFAVA